MRLLLALVLLSLSVSPLLAATPAMPQGAPNPVPEPSTFLLVGSGLVGVALTARMRRRKTPN